MSDGAHEISRSFLFSYDTGIVGGVLTLTAFEKDFGYSKAAATNVNSNCVSILQAGAFFGCFVIWPITARFGRRWSLVLSSFVFCVGAILQVVNTHSIGCFYAGRVISGFGVGAATVIVPMYSAEMAPKHIRGQLGSCFQLFFAGGVAVSYWVNYAVQVSPSALDYSSAETDYPQKTVTPGTKQWQIPIGLQLVPGGLLGIGMIFLKESVRWLAKRGRNEEALANLIWIRGGQDNEEVRIEFNEILAGIEEEIRVSEGLTWRELLLPANRFRIFIVVTMQLGKLGIFNLSNRYERLVTHLAIGVQLTGNTSLAYYTPQVFNSLGAGTSTSLVTGCFGIVKVLSCLLFVTVIVGRIGRKTAFMGGAAAMGTFMLIIAVLNATNPPSKKVTPSAIAAIIMTYCEAASYNMSWGPVSWLYLGEIFPTRLREIGIAIGSASQWLFNFALSEITPHAIRNIGWRTFLMFAIFNYALVFYAFFVLKEVRNCVASVHQRSLELMKIKQTRGRSLEEMEDVFGSVETTIDSEAIRSKVIEHETTGPSKEAGVAA
ncbi:MAG: hypothetical protein M1818_004979 [Claussenomyces sp. TS43310]|nr:MAG: hypothetical protein M1818_004979 [Claussenomyces sp. TS43310]